MKLKKDKDGIKLVREVEESISLSDLRDEKKRLKSSLQNIKKRLREIESILHHAKSIKEGAEIDLANIDGAEGHDET